MEQGRFSSSFLFIATRLRTRVSFLAFPTLALTLLFSRLLLPPFGTPRYATKTMLALVFMLISHERREHPVGMAGIVLAPVLYLYGFLALCLGHQPLCRPPNPAVAVAVYSRLFLSSIRFKRVNILIDA